VSETDTKVQGLVAMFAVLVFIAGFACSFGPIVWVVMAEVVPDSVRDKAFSIFLNVSWLCVLVSSMGTLLGSTLNYV
jgi:SP family xylose:H+ symportor-like MFS transporter